MSNHLKRIAVLLCLVVLAGCDVQPTQQAVIAGGSMAPGLAGEHYDLVCDECRYRFECDTKEPADNKVVCPNCGYREISLEGLNKQPAEQAKVILLDATKPGNIQRGDVVAFEIPGEEKGTIGVKRVVGLPGEKIWLKKGDVFVDGKIFVKSLEQQRSWRIPVFDSQFRPNNEEIPERIDGQGESALWDGFIWAYYAHVHMDRFGGDGKTPEMEWHTYRQWRCCRHDGERTDAYPVEDYYAFNQDTNRDLNPTDELFIRMEVTINPDATVFIAIPHSGIKYKASLDFKNKAATFMNPNGALGEFDISSDIKPGENVIEVSTIDHKLVLLVDGIEVLNQSIFYAKRVDEIFDIPLGVAAEKGTLQLRRLQIWRDVYYLNEGPFFAEDDSREFVVGSDEVLLLGDNSPVSSDARHWETPGIKLKQIIGTVVQE